MYYIIWIHTFQSFEIKTVNHKIDKRLAPPPLFFLLFGAQLIYCIYHKYKKIKLPPDKV